MDRGNAVPSALAYRSFRRLLSAQTISLVGTNASMIVIPTMAIETLHATPFEVGALNALQWLAFLMVGLAAGAIIDRSRRRRVMVSCDLIRLTLLLSIPAARLLGLLTIGQLLVVVAVVGVATVFYNVAYQAYLPTILPASLLADGNAKLAIGEGAARVSGPALGGMLVGAFGGPYASLADAISYLASATSLSTIGDDGETARRISFRSALLDIREGLQLVWACRPIRVIAATSVLGNFGTAIAESVVLLFVYRSLNLTPGTVGTLYTAASVGYLISALTVRRLTIRFGPGPLISISCHIAGLAYGLLALAGHGLLSVAAVLGMRLAYNAHLPIYTVNAVSVRQSLVQPSLLGRADASVRTVAFGTLGVGYFIGGAVGAAVGYIPTILIGGALNVLAGIVACLPAVWTIRTVASRPVGVATEPAPATTTHLIDG